MLSTEERAQVKALIIERIRELEESIPSLQERMGPVAPDAAIGRLSRTDSMINAGTVGLALRDAQVRLNRLRNRLEKIEAPDFERCGVCGSELSLSRILAVPDRGVCTECLSKAQQKRR